MRRHLPNIDITPIPVSFLSFLFILVLKNAILWPLSVASIMAVLVSSFQFQVGGEEGWVKPTGNQTEAYNHWATRHRFHIGDSVYFRYEEDSVLVVSSSDYENCRTSHPISKFDDGNTVFQFERSGLFYFISGQPGHCKSGQRLVIRVMHPSEEVEPPQAAPSPAAPNPNGGGGEDIWDNSNNWGPPALNSTDKLTVASYFMTFLGGVIVFLYWLM
ncbi:unnamed protein product [Coffea canephora]|uniref:Phytocyanin domain-containing protein n=1 Tax=Coffea canephora TaxID=49390 RepID=A0A068V1I0_COFCA|nr:unnamed protein product [Coffea canephora]